MKRVKNLKQLIFKKEVISKLESLKMKRIYGGRSQAGDCLDRKSKSTSPICLC
ncbi:class I lanthipeptide [uncultured Dokdonia sp.]|uniref:class I lanthipeptide n=1 Tax=uncultured Dokdonia sp. TaxID=575653 RepID=UPI002620B009|nr:class I lanthipeptide [uncultured Dokdonia sp.]